MSDPHRLRSQSLAISSDKTLAARAALAHLGRVNEAQGSQAGLALNPSFTMTPLRAGTMHVSYNPIYLAQRGRISEGMRKTGVPDG
jgi:hypothetical protein